MFLTHKYILFNFAVIFPIACNLASGDDIPVMMWNIKGNALHIKPVSALGHNDNDFVGSLKDILHKESNIVVFTVNKLSLEDFSSDKPTPMNNTLNYVETFLDIQPHVLWPSVKNPLNYIHKAHCGVQEIVVDNKIDESILHSLSLALQKSCVVILHISDEGIIPNEGEIQSLFIPSFEDSNKNCVGIFTGVKSSWGSQGSPNYDHHKNRILLQAPTNDDNFVNYTGCIIMYAENASITLGKVENGSSSQFSLPFPPSLEGSSCENSSNAILQLTYKTSGSATSVILKFEFPQSRGSWKTKTTLSVTGEKFPSEDIILDSAFIEAPVKFSFSCGDLLLKSINKSTELTVRFSRFQIQPYQVQEAFSDSFDCVTFFTIPIWMGIVVSMLFIIIINIGIYALFSVHTMDRFDDPKGKSITVGAAAD